MESQKTLNSPSNFETEEQAESIVLLKTNYITKTQQLKKYGIGIKHEQMEQNRELSNKPIYDQLIYSKGIRYIHLIKGQSLQ